MFIVKWRKQFTIVKRNDISSSTHAHTIWLYLQTLMLSSNKTLSIECCLKTPISFHAPLLFIQGLKLIIVIHKLTKSDWVRGVRRLSWHITGHFRDEIFQAIDCTGIANQTRGTENLSFSRTSSRHRLWHAYIYYCNALPIYGLSEVDR